MSSAKWEAKKHARYAKRHQEELNRAANAEKMRMIHERNLAKGRAALQSIIAEEATPDLDGSAVETQALTQTSVDALADFMLADAEARGALDREDFTVCPPTCTDKSERHQFTHHNLGWDSMDDVFDHVNDPNGE